MCQQTGAELRVVPMDDRGQLELDEYRRLLDEHTRVVSIVHLSNAIGTINPVREIVAAAHDCGAVVLLDGAQAVSHMRVDVRSLDCDFYAFSGHKLYGPTGIGVLYGKETLLDAMEPYQTGGEMIKRVTFEATEFNDLPHKFEAGTPNIAGAVGLGAAIDYVLSIGYGRIAAHEAALLRYATESIGDIAGVRLIGTAREKAAVLSFVLDSVHAHDIGTIMDKQGVAIRVGHHCTMPLMQRFGVAATARASFGLYNNRAEIDALVAGIGTVKEIFAR